MFTPRPSQRDAEAAGGHPAVGLLELQELRRPHLVLAHLGGEVDVAVPGQLLQALQRVLRLDDRVRLAVREVRYALRGQYSEAGQTVRAASRCGADDAGRSAGFRRCPSPGAS